MNKLNKKIIKVVASLFLASFGFVSLSRSNPMPVEEQKAILSAITEGLKTKYMFIDGDPEMHDPNRMAEIWEKFLVLQVLRASSSRVPSREEFEKTVNQYLQSYICSHLYLGKISDTIACEVSKRLEECGLRYIRYMHPTFPVPLFMVTFVDPKGIAYNVGIRTGQIFSLPDWKVDQSTFGATLNHISFGKWPLTFYTKEKTYTISLTAKRSYLKGPCESNNEYEQSIAEEEKGKILPLIIKSFSSNYKGAYIAGALQYAIQSLDHLVIDLRFNKGGAASNLIHLLSYFLEPQTHCFVTADRKVWRDFTKTDGYQEAIETFKRQNSQLNNEFGKVLVPYVIANRSDLCYTVTDSGPKFKGKVAILIDKYTASAAEVAAGVLRELLGPERCTLIGKRSAGAVLNTEWGSTDIIGRYYIKYPIADVLLPSGTRIEGKGVTPDVEASNTAECLEIAKKWFEDPSIITPRYTINDGSYFSNRLAQQAKGGWLPRLGAKPSELEYFSNFADIVSNLSVADYRMEWNSSERNTEAHTLTSLEKFTRLTKLDLSGMKVSSGDLKYLLNLKDLKELNLQGYEGTELTCLSQTIETLDLIDAKLTSENIATLPKGLIKLVLSRTNITDADLERLPNLENLTELDLMGCDITGSGLKRLPEACPDLTYLTLEESYDLIDISLKYVSKLKNLTELWLGNCREITDAGVQCLSSLENLEKLDIGGCRNITGDAFEYLPKSLRWLLLECCENITGHNLKHLSHLEGLEQLNLSSCTKITDTDLQCFPENLIILNLSYTNITDKGLEYFSKLEKVEDLSLAGCKGITGFGLAAFSNLLNLTALDLSGCSINGGMDLIHLPKSLKKLNLYGTNITDEGLKSISHLENVEVLSLGGCDITDEGLLHLSSLKNLKELYLNGCKQVSKNGVDQLRKSIPNFRVML